MGKRKAERPSFSTQMLNLVQTAMTGLKGEEQLACDDVRSDSNHSMLRLMSRVRLQRSQLSGMCIHNGMCILQEHFCSASILALTCNSCIWMCGLLRQYWPSFAIVGLLVRPIYRDYEC